MTIKELKELIIKLEVVLNHNSVIKPCDYLPAVHLIEGDVTGVKSKRGLGGFGSSGA